MSDLLTKIQKEDLHKLLLKEKEVYKDLNKIVERLRKLKQAMTLGNAYKHKIKIIFEDKFGSLLLVETTIWYVTDLHVQLKGGVIIPTTCIHDVSY